jgi:hypothetical protein
MVAGGVKTNIIVRRITKLNTTFITIPVEAIIRIKLLSNGCNEARGSSRQPSQTQGQCLICNRRAPPRSGRSCRSRGRGRRASRRGDPDELEIKLSKQGAGCRRVFIFVPMADRAKTFPGKGLLPTFLDTLDVEGSQPFIWVVPLLHLLIDVRGCCCSCGFGTFGGQRLLVQPNKFKFIVVAYVRHN